MGNPQPSTLKYAVNRLNVSWLVIMMSLRYSHMSVKLNLINLNKRINDK